jgi:hypothetical protein
MNTTALLIRLLIAHLIADFLLQTKTRIEQRKSKKWRSPWLYAHSFMYAALIYSATSNWDQFYWIIPAVFAIHLVIDGVKAGFDDNVVVFSLDQLAHMIVLVVLWGLLASITPGAIAQVISEIWNSSKILLIVAGYLFILWPTGYFIGKLTSRLCAQIPSADRAGLDEAGFWIGCLERLFVYSFVLIDQLAAISILIGVKSIYRLGAIRASERRKEAEYILIGTLISFAIAMAAGYIVRSLI